MKLLRWAADDEVEESQQQKAAHSSVRNLPMPVDTKKVQGRRKVDYSTYEEMLADADRLASGPVKALGNWSAGQIFRHLAIVYTNSIDGFTFTMPLYIRVAARMFKKRILNGSMPPGFNLPPDGAEAMVPGPTTTEEGLAELHAAVARLKQEQRRVKHPVFGDISKEEWDSIHLKHASLHMSFLVPE
jgi:hypothetical protein